MSTTGRGELRFVRYGSRVGYWNSIRPPGTVGLLEIPGSPGYLAGDDGRIYSTWVKGYGARPDAKPPRQLQERSSRYASVTLAVGGKHQCRAVHDLICRAFHGKPPGGVQVSHLNGRRGDNRPENLAWETPGQNTARKIEHGTSQVGERNGCAKVSDRESLEIRDLYGSGLFSQAAIGSFYGLAQCTISEIVRGKKYAHTLEARS